MFEYRINFQSYLIGFITSIILTFFSFFTVFLKKIFFFKKKKIIINILFILAIIQIIVHIIYFLHVDLKEEKGWIILSLIFTCIIVFIVILGSIWVMNNLSCNMSIS